MRAKRQKSTPRTLRNVLTGAVAILVTAVLVGGILAGCSAAASAPDVTKLEWNTSTIIYDRNQEEFYRLHAGENRTPVKLNQIPKHVIDALIAVEDPSFYDHHGVDPKGTARGIFKSAMYYLGIPGGRVEGGSTITQQLARDAWLSKEVSLKRKAQEAWVALQLERTYTKDEILEMYLNQVYFGSGAYGVEAAARTFFAKEVGELTLSEGAQLVGQINGPGIFDPYLDMEASLHRRTIVLQAMLKEGYITQDVYEKAKAEEPKLGRKKADDDGMEAGHFVDYVISVLQQTKPGLAEKYGLKLGEVGSVAKAGLRVYTTVDPRLQEMAEEAVEQQMNTADKEYGLAGRETLPEAAMLSMNPKTGEILAMVGGRDHDALLEFNRATDALRQPGSAIKPLVAYTPALEAGLSPGTILDDAPVMLTTDGKTVWPQNYDYKYLGLKSMRYGVEQSLNPLAVRAMQLAGGPAKAAEIARRFGLTTIGKDDEHLALALGGVTRGTTVLDMTTAYSAIANMGLKVDPVLITRIEDRTGTTIYEAAPKKQQVVKPATAWLMIDMMKDVIKKGTAYGFTGGFKGWPAAGKTGTTEYNRDGWFIGFTPDLVTTVWNGYDNPDNRLPWTAAFVPVKIWNQYMTQAVTAKPADWTRPADVVSVQICRATGALPAETCPKDQVVSEWYVKGTEPKTASDILVKAKAVQVTVQTPDKKSTYQEWQLWQNGCLGTPVERAFIKRPFARVLHPTDPFNPKYVPADAKDELPTKQCQPGTFWDKVIPSLPNLPKLPWLNPGDVQQPAPPATTTPGTGTQQPAPTPTPAPTPVPAPTPAPKPVMPPQP